jgi:hypothetical protein
VHTLDIDAAYHDSAACLVGGADVVAGRLESFWRTPRDAVAIGSFIIEKPL